MTVQLRSAHHTQARGLTTDESEPHMSKVNGKVFKAFSRGSWTNASAVADILRLETVGGALLLVSAVVALVWANSPASESYFALSDTKIGSDAFFHLNLSVAHWTADGLLAIFFFVAGLELKREFVVGDLRDPRRAAVPIAAAACGVVVPAALYLAVTSGDSSLAAGWAIPAATDIAFALAVLAVIGSSLPSALRAFLLTLAVVDDLLAIIIIAVAYTDHVSLLWLVAAAIPIAIYSVLTHRNITKWYLLIPLALMAWVFLHESGIHATIAGVALGLATPVQKNHRRDISVAHRFEHLVRPVSAGFAVPCFALFASGVSVVGDGFSQALSDPVVWGIVVGLVVGKVIGIFGGTFVAVKVLRGKLDDAVEWIDLLGVAILAGIGFTVSLLVNDLAFDGAAAEHGRVGVLLGSVLAALLASIPLMSRNRHYRKLAEIEQRDDDHDGIPDVYEKPSQ